MVWNFLRYNRRKKTKILDKKFELINFESDLIVDNLFDIDETISYLTEEEAQNHLQKYIFKKKLEKIS